MVQVVTELSVDHLALRSPRRPTFCIEGGVAAKTAWPGLDPGGCLDGPNLLVGWRNRWRALSRDDAVAIVIVAIIDIIAVVAAGAVVPVVASVSVVAAVPVVTVVINIPAIVYIGAIHSTKKIAVPMRQRALMLTLSILWCIQAREKENGFWLGKSILHLWFGKEKTRPSRQRRPK